MAVEYIGNVVMPYDAVFIVLMPMKYGPQVGLLSHKLYETPGFDGVGRKLYGRDVNEQQNMLCCLMFPELRLKPVQVRRKILPLYIGCSGK
jgi:hypothetical protein